MLQRACCLLFAFAVTAAAQVPKPQYPPTDWPIRNGSFDIHNFRFGTGEALPDAHLHYLTLGTLHGDAEGHADNAVLLLHGTGGSAHSLLNPVFSDVLFGPGQPLDITRYFIILPDDIGHGESSKPSDGLRMKFPRYTYDDMVRSQHEMLVDGLHVDHLRLILGTSMGCMQSFVWGETYPQFSDALAPFACLPIEIAGRNRMWRYMAMQSIRDDPAWDNGNYTHEPIEGLRRAADFIVIAGSAPQQMQKDFPTRQQPRTTSTASSTPSSTIPTPTTSSTTSTHPATITLSRRSAPSPLRSSGSTPRMTSSTRRNWTSPRSWSPECRTPASS